LPWACPSVLPSPAPFADGASWRDAQVKKLGKKLRQIDELEERRAKGEELNADQEGKIAAKERLTAELEKLQALKDKL
jgi:uncharacterized protein with WD repeat